MDEMMGGSGAARPGNALVLFDRRNAGELRHVQIEGSWKRLEPRRCPPPSRRIATLARTVLLVWGGVSLAAVGGAALVYAHGGLERPASVHAEAPVAPAAAAASAVETPLPKPVRVIPVGRPAGPAAAPLRVAWTPPAPAQPAAATSNDAPAPQLPTLAAPPEPATTAGPVVLVAAMPSQSSEQAADAAPPAAEEAQPAVEARLPRARPEPPVETASIERQWEEFRAARHGGRYEAMRGRFLHRHKMAPL